MKKLHNIKLLMLSCLLLTLGFLTSCGDDEDTEPNAGKVELISFGPTGVMHGEELRFIGRNLTKVEAIELPGATVPKSAFISQTSDLIVIKVPEEATEGTVTLKTADGDITSKTILSFEVPITITSVTAEARPGANITITGTKLNWVEGVLFESDTVDTFVSQSATELVLEVPETAKTGKLILIGGGTEPAFVETEEELIVTLPAVTALSPATLYNGQNLKITGTNLDLVKEIAFTGVGEAKVSSFVSQSATELVVKVPENAAKGIITLIVASGVEVPTTQEVTLVLPAVTAISPAPVGHESELTLTGTDLDLVKEVAFTGVGDAIVNTFVSQSENKLVMKVPANASNGTLTLLAKSGVEVTTAQEVSIMLPAITTLSPSPVDPGQQLTINGTNLDLVKSIEFQGEAVATTFVSQTPTRIVVVVPMEAKKGALTLTTIHNYVVETEAQVTIVLPAITDVTPEPVIPGNFLTITGTELSLVKSVVFEGGATVSSFIAQNNSQIVLTVPASAESGVLTLITHSNFKVVTDKQAQIGSVEPNIDHYIYDDALSAEWQLWGGWGKTLEDLANTEQVSRGEKAIKLSFNDAYGAFQLHPTNANILAGYTHIVLYVRGGEVDSRAAIQVKTTSGGFSGEGAFDVKAGKYQLIEVPISALGDVSEGISEFYIKNYGTNPNTFWVDDIGLR